MKTLKEAAYFEMRKQTKTDNKFSLIKLLNNTYKTTSFNEFKINNMATDKLTGVYLDTKFSAKYKATTETNKRSNRVTVITLVIVEPVKNAPTIQQFSILYFSKLLIRNIFIKCG